MILENEVSYLQKAFRLGKEVVVSLGATQRTKLSLRQRIKKDSSFYL